MTVLPHLACQLPVRGLHSGGEVRNDYPVRGDPRAHDAAVYITTVENGLIGLVAQAKDVISGLGAFAK